jgi:hypothetical protein
MVRTAVAGGIAMARQNDVGLQFSGTRDGSIEVIDFKPEEHSIAIWLAVRISNQSVVMLDIKSVQLEDQRFF